MTTQPIQTFIEKMTGFKATKADMTCQGHQFELGKWYEVSEVTLCERGFHFCVHPSGPWSYYSETGTRVFKVEAEQVLECPIEAGAGFKLVAKRIRLTEEITPGGNNCNTGYSNTGHSNTGHSNTGHSNTGDWNATNFSAGFFCRKEPKVISFDTQTQLTREQFRLKYPEAAKLGQVLCGGEPIPFDKFKHIPGITKKKLAALHKAHIEGRKAVTA